MIGRTRTIEIDGETYTLLFTSRVLAALEREHGVSMDSAHEAACRVATHAPLFAAGVTGARGKDGERLTEDEAQDILDAIPVSQVTDVLLQALSLAFFGKLPKVDSEGKGGPPESGDGSKP